MEERDLWASLANMALHLGDDATHRRYYHAMRSAARADGAVMEVFYALHRLALSELAAGEWRTGHRMVEHAMSSQGEIAAALGISQPAVSQQLKAGSDLARVHPEALLEAAAPVLRRVAKELGYTRLAVFGSVARVRHGWTPTSTY